MRVAEVLQVGQIRGPEESATTVVFIHIGHLNATTLVKKPTLIVGVVGVDIHEGGVVTIRTPKKVYIFPS